MPHLGSQPITSPTPATLTPATSTPETPAPGLVDQAWRLAASVSLRPEPFGALAYDFHTRQLSFLKTLTLVAVVKALAGAPTVGGALADAGVPPDQWSAYLAALARLADTGLIQPQENLA